MTRPDRIGRHPPIRLQSRGTGRDAPRFSSVVAHKRRKRPAFGRVGEPDDIGPMIASLLSDDNRWVNGQRIEVSGGMAL
ncbi:SDR family oxidoreductase [Burkholderia sp. SIMBA_051]|uniref:SDR family oxidoreductase n=1 Tax=Burkholderia sp. SIMBA_051 TaxID=3085792 RepID=UPI00397DF1AD